MQELQSARNQTLFSHNWKSIQESSQITLRKKKRQDYISCKRLISNQQSDDLNFNTTASPESLLLMKLQFEVSSNEVKKSISCYLQNLAYRGQREVNALIEAGFIEFIVNLLPSQTMQVCENLLGVLINIAATGKEYRKKVAESGVLKVIVQLVYCQECSVSFLKIIALVLRNVVQVDVNVVEEDVRTVIEMVGNLIGFDFPKMNLNCLYVMNSLTYVGIIKEFTSDHYLNFLFSKASDSSNDSIQTISLQVLDNFIIDSNKYILLLLSKDLIPLLQSALASYSQQVVLKSIQILGHLIESPAHKIKPLFTSSIFSSLLPLIPSPVCKIHEEVSYVLYSLSSYSKHQNISSLFLTLFSQDILSFLSQGLNLIPESSKSLLNLLVFIDQFLKVLLKSNPQLQPCIHNSCIREALANCVILYKGDSREVLSRLEHLLNEYWEDSS